MEIQLFKPTYNVEGCLAAIKECLDIGWTGLGNYTDKFEEAWKKYTGFENAHFTNSATEALHLAFQIYKDELGWNNESEVISSSITFISSNHAISYTGMKVVFADVDESLCLDPIDVEKKITEKTKAILFVGFGGNIGQIFKVAELAKKYNLKLIVDFAHCAGTRYDGKIVGPEFDCTIYSYQAVKNLPISDAGMICFKDKELDVIVRKMSWLGIDKNTFLRTVNEAGAYKWKYDVKYLGFKSHGNSISAAIGITQLKELDKDNSYRRQIATWYDSWFIDKIKVIPITEGCETSRHLYVIEVDNRDELILALNGSGVYPGVHYISNTEYDMYSYAKGTIPYSERMDDRILSLPMHLQLTKEEVDYVAKKVLEYSYVS